MAVFTHTDTHTVIGTLDNGLKIVQTLITSTDGANSGTATPITINPLTRIVEFNFFPRDPGTTPTTYIAAKSASYLSGTNKVYVTPAGVPAGCVLEVISVGE